MTYINYFFTRVKMPPKKKRRRNTASGLASFLRSDTNSSTPTFTGAESKTTNTDLLKAIRDGKKMFELTSGKKLGRILGSGSYGTVFAIFKQRSLCVKIEIIRGTNTEEMWTESLAYSKMASEIGCGPHVYNMYTHPLCVTANQEQVCFGYTIMERCAKLPKKLDVNDFMNIFGKIEKLGQQRMACFDMKPDNTMKKLNARDFYITDYGARFCRRCPVGTETGYIFLMKMMLSIVFQKYGHPIPPELKIMCPPMCQLERLQYRFTCYKTIHWYIYRDKTKYGSTQICLERIYRTARAHPNMDTSVSELVEFYMDNSKPPRPATRADVWDALGSSYDLRF